MTGNTIILEAQLFFFKWSCWQEENHAGASQNVSYYMTKNPYSITCNFNMLCFCGGKNFINWHLEATTYLYISKILSYRSVLERNSTCAERLKKYLLCQFCPTFGQADIFLSLKCLKTVGESFLLQQKTKIKITICAVQVLSSVPLN